MSGRAKFWVLDHTGATVACKDNAADAVEVAEWYAKNFGVSDVVHGSKRKRFLASGKVYTVREQWK